METTHLVWERCCDFIIENTDYSFFEEARIDGKGPVVACIGRLPDCNKIYIRGKCVFLAKKSFATSHDPKWYRKKRLWVEQLFCEKDLTFERS